MPAPSPAAAPAHAPRPAAAAPAPLRGTLRDRATAAAPGAAAFDPLVPVLQDLSTAADTGVRLRLQQLQARVNGPWVEAQAPADPAWGEPIRAADGRLLGRVLQEAASMLWQDRDGLLWRAPLAADNRPR